MENKKKYCLGFHPKLAVIFTLKHKTKKEITLRDFI